MPVRYDQEHEGEGGSPGVGYVEGHASQLYHRVVASLLTR